MSNPRLYYPVKPVHINQAFGSNREYYNSHFGTDGHMGIDFMASHGQPVYAAHDGTALAIKDSHGGEGVWLYSTDNSFITIYWHLIGDTETTNPVVPFDNKFHDVKAGDIIGYADNTGAPFESSGDHLHFGLVFIDKFGNFMNRDNGFNGCVDPEPYFTGINAQDVAKLIYIESALVVALQKLVNYYLKLRS